MSGDAADEVVRIMLNGTEVAVRLAGSGVKNLAALLIAWITWLLIFRLPSGDSRW